MSQTQLTDFAIFILRVTLGIMFLAHSLILKLFILTLPGTVQIFESLGIAGWLAYVVFAAEVVAGFLLVLGVQTRWVALATVPILIGATWTHSSNGWLFLNENGGWEYPAYLTLLALVQGLTGGGSFELNRSMSLATLVKLGRKEAT